MKLSHPISRRVSLLMIAAAGISAGCERPGPVATPAADEFVRQNSAAGNTNLVFSVFRQGVGTPIQYATISVYLNPNATTPPTVCSNGEFVTGRNCWLVTDANGKANIVVPSGTNFGYLVRVLPPEWLNLTGLVVPPLTPGNALTAVANDLGSATCGTTGAAISFSPNALVQCINNLYASANGTTKNQEVGLQTVTPRGVVVNDLQGNPVTTGVPLTSSKSCRSRSRGKTCRQV